MARGSAWRAVFHTPVNYTRLQIVNATRKRPTSAFFAPSTLYLRARLPFFFFFCDLSLLRYEAVRAREPRRRAVARV